MHRYRDIDASIREQCLEALGSWISGYPSFFLKDKYTKYLGWMLNDKVTHVPIPRCTVLCGAVLYFTPLRLYFAVL